MFPPAFYTHPRPFVAYEQSSLRPSQSATNTPTMERRRIAVQTSIDIDAPFEVASGPSCIVDGRGSFTVSCSDRPFAFVTENVGEALRCKQRMQARAALGSNININTIRLRDLPELLTSSSPSSCASSPTSTPPTTPTELVPGVDFPMVAVVRPERRARSPSVQITTADHADHPGRWLSPSGHVGASPPPPPRSHPSRSSPSVMCRSLSRRASNHTLSATVAPEGETRSTRSLLDLVKRLAPLPRFNPFRRARAVSMSSIVDDRRRQFPEPKLRKRCQSEPAASPRPRTIFGW